MTSSYKIHVYVCYNEFFADQDIAIRRENLITGKFDFLREGGNNWPEAIVKTLIQVGVPASLYKITREQFDASAWHDAIELPESEW